MRNVSVIMGIVLLWLFSYPWHTGLGPGADFAMAETAGQPGVLFYDTLNFWNTKAGSLRVEKIRAKSAISEQVKACIANINFLNASMNSKYELKRGMVTFRFDDGYKDVIDSAASLLAQFGYTGIAGIIADIPSKNLPNFMNWDELRHLYNYYGWEICSHSYQHRRYYDNWTEIWNDIVVSKQILQDSIGCPISTFIMPFGYDSILGYYLIRSVYTAALWAEPRIGDSLMKPPFDPYHLGGYFIPDDSSAIDSLMELVADSGWWYITLIHDASSNMQKIRWLLQAVNKYHIDVVTIREGLSRINSSSQIGPMRVSALMQESSPNWNVAEILESGVINYAGDNWDFWNWENGYPLNWTVSFSNPDDSVYEMDLGEGIAGVGNVNIPGKSMCVDLKTLHDTVWISKIFNAPKADTVKMEIYWNYWFGVVGSWQLKDSTSDIYWDATNAIWSSSEIWNNVNKSYYPGEYLYLYEKWLFLPESTYYRFSIRAYNPQSANTTLRIAAFQLYPTCKPAPPTLSLEFKTPFKDWSVSVKSSLDFLFDNGVGPVLTSPNGIKYRLKVDDSGNLSTERIP